MRDATMATGYRCDLLDIDHIAAVCIIECDDDDDALLEAGRILKTSPCTAVEVWYRHRKVSIIGKKDAAPHGNGNRKAAGKISFRPEWWCGSTVAKLSR
jgi:hypothetical protein